MRKGQSLKKLKPGQIVRGRDVNELILLFNALMNMRFVNGTANEVLIGDLGILLRIKGAGSDDTTTNGSYRGEYSPDGLTEFNPGPFAFDDLVQISPTNPNAYPTGTIIPGFYICIKDNPSPTDLPNHTLSPGGLTTFWRLVSTWPSTVNICNSDGTTTEYFADEQPGNAS